MTETQPTHEEIQTFKAPRAHFGQTVAYFVDGIKNSSRKPELGFMYRPGERVSHIFVPTGAGGGMVREAVRHIDDPKLRMNDDQRSEGGWDFTEYDKGLVARDAYIEKRFRAIEGALINPIKTDRAVLLLTAQRLGLKGCSRQGNDEVRARILAAQAEMGETEETEPEEGTPEA